MNLFIIIHFLYINLLFIFPKKNITVSEESKSPFDLFNSLFNFQCYLFRHRPPVISVKQVSVTGRVPKPIDFECAFIERMFDPVSHQLMGDSGPG